MKKRHQKDVTVGFMIVFCELKMMLDGYSHISFVVFHFSVVPLQCFSGLMHNYLQFFIHHLISMSLVEIFPFDSLKQAI